MPQGYNVYSYALNNPLVFKDPSGMFLPILIGAIIAIAYIAAVATVAAFAVGFVTGLVYGLANGQGWSSLLTALETALTTTVGMWLGGITGFLVGGPVGLVIGAIMGGMNGLISGMTGIYNWKSIDGWLAFLSDSTWGLVGTSLGAVIGLMLIALKIKGRRDRIPFGPFLVTGAIVGIFWGVQLLQGYLRWACFAG